MYKTLILSGGGASGFIQLGVLTKMAEKIATCDRYVGTSVGSIISLLIITGLSPEEIIKIASSVEFKMPTIMKMASNFITSHGVTSINPFIAEVEKILIKKYGKIPTMKELFILTRKTFIVCVTDLREGKLLEMSHETSPDELCTDVVNMSCRIPFIFTPVKGRYVDGGIKCNFPAHLSEGKTLGIWTKAKINESISSLYEYVGNIIMCMTPESITIPDNMDLIECSHHSSWFMTTEKQRQEMISLGKSLV